MSTLKSTDKRILEQLFRMSGGTVLDFTNRSFADFFKDFKIDIYSEKYQATDRTGSKANRLRTFWEIEDDSLVADVIQELVYLTYLENSESLYQPTEQWNHCEAIIKRLQANKVNLGSLKKVAEKLDLHSIDRQIKRMEESIEKDPDLAIGTSKELIESCCKTILHEMNVSFDEKKIDVPQLSKLTLENLKLTPETVDPKAKGAEITKKILGNLGQISHSMAELRNLYGTGHGKTGKSSSLQARHARLAVSCASAFAHFVFETFEERTKS